MNSMYAQRGMSYWGVMSLILVAVMFLKVGIVAIPAYMDDRLVNETINSRLLAAPTSTQPLQLYGELAQQFNMNNLRDLDANEILTVTNVSGLQVIKNYEIRKNLIANMDLVLHFEKTFDQRAIKSGSGS
jgi:hypothetical protein